MKKPQDITFLMVGCQRCGTTWVDAALREHPEIYLPEKKQSYFFDRNYDRGMDWFMSRFEGAKAAHRAVGEVATGYSLPQAVERMAKDLPHLKIIMAMRNPIERAYSNYRVRFVEEGWSSFEDALEKSPDLLERGQYADQIEHLLQFYPRDRLLLLIYDDLVADDRAYLRSIYEFLGVDPDFQSSLIGQRSNAAMFTRSRGMLNRLGLKPVLRMLSRSRAGKLVRRLKKQQGAVKQEISAETRGRLVEHFRPFNQKLGEHLERALMSWEA